MGGISIITNTNVLSLQKVEAITSYRYIQTTETANGFENNASLNTTACANGAYNFTAGCTLIKRSAGLICNNGADDVPTCILKADKSCFYGGTPPNCNVLGFNNSYLPMAAAGQELTAGMAETDANVTDARRKYLTSLSETKSVMIELQSIATDYNEIIKKAQARRTLEVGKTPELKCTFNELISYQTN